MADIMQQNFKMLPQMDGRSLQPPFRPLSVLVLYLLLAHLCRASDAASSPVISLLGSDRNRGGVVLNCKSKGWYPEPEVFWLDSEGNQLSAGPTDTVRGPDGLYTVSSRVTVEKRHSNSFTCRVHQKNINQTRETEIYIPDDFFEVQSGSAVTAGLAVGLSLCILIILTLVFLVWRQNKIKTKRSHRDETDEGEKKNLSQRNKPGDQFVTEGEREREPLRAHDTEQKKDRNEGKGEKKSKHFKKQQLEEQQRREEAESRVKTLKEELETKKKEVEPKQAELQQLHEEKQRNKKDLQTLKEELKKKNKQLETIRAELAEYYWLSPSQNRSKKAEQLKKAEKELQTLKKKLEPLEMELVTKIKKVVDKQAEVQQLQDEIQTMETNLQEDLETNKMEWSTIPRQKFEEEQQRRVEAETRVKILEEELQTTARELKETKQKVSELENSQKQ